MSDSPFEGKADFNNQWFYYFLPMFNFEQKQKIGEKIAKFKGLISFSLKENINILINQKADLSTSKFANDVLSYGNVNFYDGDKIHEIKCINKSLSNPENYKCIQLDLFWKIVGKFDESDEMINYFKKKGLKDNVNLPSSIIYQLPSYNLKLFNCFEFPKIEETALINKSITEYDIPQFIPDMPQGFSLFCTLWEATRVRQYLLLDQEEKNKLFGTQQKEDNENENDIVCENILEEPIPKTNFCHLCMRKFDDYLVHIETLTHKNNISKNPLFINRAKNTFNRINQFWEEKDVDKSNLDNNISQSEKNLKFEHNRINSISALSSAASTFKNEESVSFIKSMNSFLLEQELIESEKNKENINENIQTKKKNNKNKLDFITPKSKTECKLSSYYPSSHSNLNLMLSKKRKLCLDEEKNEKNGDYFKSLNPKKTKKLIRDKDVFFK
jgi:hypothetical protein